MSDFRSFLNPKRAAHYGRNGGKATAVSRKHTLRVDGEYVTYEQIAERMGYTLATANRKVRARLRAGHTLTWEALK